MVSRLRATALLAVVLLGACDGNLQAPITEHVAAGPRLQLISGNSQYGQASQTLSQPLVVKAFDVSGNPLSGQIVNFVVTSGGGSVIAGTNVTNANGLAQDIWTLGPSGTQTVEVRAVDNNTGAPGVFGTFTAYLGTPVASRVVVTPDTLLLPTIGQTAQLQAQVLDQNGLPMAASVSWAPLGTSVATVSASGLATAQASGTARIVASAGVVADTTVVVVGPVARVTVTPATSQLSGLGTTVQLMAQAYDGSGTALSGQTYAWSSSNTAVATVSGSGLVTATGAGTATITATDAGVQGSASLTVSTASSGASTTGDPAPGSTDAVIFDTRAGGAQSMQGASTWAAAIAASTLVDENNDHDAGTLINGITVHHWEWAPNFDGRGTHAFQGNVTATGCGDLGGYSLYRTLPISYKNITVQYKFWLSKNPNDTSHTALGSPGSWTVAPNPACAPYTSTHGQHKRLLIGRTPTNTRADLIFTNGGDPRYPTAISIEGWYFSGAEPDHYVNWVPELHVNQINTMTMQLQAESATGASDGVIRLWMNGQLVFQSTTAHIGTDLFYRLQLPSTVSDPQLYQTEYIWDVVAWTTPAGVR